MGIRGDIELKKHGFYPAGEGLIEAKIKKCTLEKIDLIERGNLVSVNGLCVASNDLQKQQVAERMQGYLRSRLFDEFNIVPNVKIAYVDAASAGGGCDLFAVYEDSVIGAASVAERGKRAEDVANDALELLVSANKSDAALDKHMADQIVPYLALFGGSVSVEEITEHARTNMWVCEQFLNVHFNVDESRKIIECKK